MMVLNRHLSAFSLFSPTSPHPQLLQSKERVKETGNTSQTARKGRDRAAVIEHLSGLVGEAEQEGGGRMREPGWGEVSVERD